MSIVAEAPDFHFPHRHLLGIEGLTPAEITGLLDLADEAAELSLQASHKADILRGRTQINLFFEDSTRTQSSFELAGKRLGANVMNMSVKSSSMNKGETVIGNDNWIMAYVHIAHDCQIGSKTIMANNTTLAGHVHVGDWAIFAGFAGAHQFVHVGAHSFLGMYTGANQDVPAYVMLFGLPGAPAGINSEGLKRRDFSKEQIRNIKNAYRVVYRNGLKLAEAIAEIEDLVAEQPELAIFLESLKTSKRGVAR